jgi:hypothetical protein
MGKVMRSHMRVIVVLLSAAATVGLVSCPHQSHHSTEAQDPNATSESGPKGYALAIGLNRVDPNHYVGAQVQELFGCEPDAEDMRDMALSQGLTTCFLPTAQATRKNVLDKLDNLAQTLKPGDLLVVSYSGHGGYVEDRNDDEDDGLDETWCLYDGQLIDDELHGAWMKFQPGVRILLFSDSCFSGTICKMTKADMENPTTKRIEELDSNWKARRVPAGLDRAKILALPEMHDALRKRPLLRERVERLTPPTTAPNVGALPLPAEKAAGEVFVARSMSPEVLRKTYKAHKEFYDNLGRAAPKEDPNAVKASLILISACAEDKTALDMGVNGLFTLMVKKVWRDGTFIGDHRRFHQDVRDLVKKQNPEQVPNLLLEGAGSESFVQQRPYKVQ